MGRKRTVRTTTEVKRRLVPKPDNILFEVRRDGDEVLLRPMKETDVVHLSDPNQSREFITGTLKTNPFKDGSKPMTADALDGNWRTTR